MTTSKNDVEKQLLSRLRIMGYLLFFISFCSFLFAFLAPYYASTEEYSELSLSIKPVPAHEELNFYAIGVVFAAVGMTCLFISWRKTR